MMRYFLALFVFCSAAMAEETTYFFGETDVIGHRFVLDRLNGEKFTSPREVFIEFPERGKIAGRICNAFHGDCTVERYILTADVASTRMLCPDPQLRQFENDFFNFMRMGIGFVRAGDILEFRRDNVHAEFRLAGAPGEKNPAAEADAPAPALRPDSGGADASADAVAAKDLEGRKFVLEQANGEPFRIKMGQQPFIQFDKGMKVNGRACNVFMGPGELKDGKLFMPNAASTMMMCVDPLLSNYERDFHKMLQGGAAISLKDDELTLSGNGQTYLYKQEK